MTMTRPDDNDDGEDDDDNEEDDNDNEEDDGIFDICSAGCCWCTGLSLEQQMTR